MSINGLFMTYEALINDLLTIKLLVTTDKAFVKCALLESGTGFLSAKV